MALLNLLLYLLCLITEELSKKFILVLEPVTLSPNFTRVLSNVLLPCFINNWLYFILFIFIYFYFFESAVFRCESM